MKQKFLIIAILFMLANYGAAQIIDNYGFNVGLTYTNQFWHYKLFPFDNSDQDYKIGFSAFLSAEKKMNKIISIRSEIGYIQKGFKNNVELSFGDGTYAGVDKENVIFHDLGLNLGLKITPFDLKFAPYALVGLRCDYMLSYKDIVFEDPGSGSKLNMYKFEIDNFNKLNMGGLIAVGFEFNELVYMEIGYNPSITSSVNEKSLQVKDNCWEVKIGLNINQLKTN